MKVVGIIAEYNPFHNGHKLMIEKCRELGATHVVVVMSGNFVQRGSVAIMDKRQRAKSALLGGADLVIELPVNIATQTAERFARGGVQILDALGVCDAIAFGVENDDKELLLKAAEAVLDERVDTIIKRELEGGVNYATARETAVREVYGEEISEVLTKPNNILAVEYIKARNKINPNMELMPIKREKVDHDSTSKNGSFASASTIRTLLEQKDESAFDFIPVESKNAFLEMCSVGRAPATLDEGERAILGILRNLSKEDIKNAPDVSEGLESRIYNAIKTATSLEELYDIIKTKRYTHSRIRRIISSLFLGLSEEDIKLGAQYIRILGMNERGREVLKMAKEFAKLPVITKTAHISELSKEANRVFELECKATDLYNLSTPRILPCGTEYKDEIIMI